MDVERRADVFQSRAYFGVLMGRKENLQQSLAPIKDRKAGFIVVPFKKETEYAHLLRGQGDEEFLAVFRRGQAEGTSFFHGRSVARAFLRRKARLWRGWGAQGSHPFAGNALPLRRPLNYAIVGSSFEPNARWRMFNESSPVIDPVRIFRNFLKTKGLRNTPQRQRIMEVFFGEDGHLTTEEVYDRVHREDPSLGQATVYRTMKLLCEAGLAREVRFGDGLARYEHAGDAHHDHLICENCGRNIEVVDPQIEALQEALALRHGFKPTFHRLYLYGICPDCQKNR